jgi:hypothetical protein
MSERLIKFREVVRPPLWLMAFIYFLALSLVIAIWASLTNTIAAITFITLTIATIAIYFSSALRIEVDESELKVGKAHISLEHIGDIQVLTDKQMLAKRTRDADPAAYLAIRFWTPRGVVITIADTRDATPYWLVTSKKGEKLARAIKG